LREEISRRQESVFNIITMASLIENEVDTDKERSMVSGVLWKRIREDIPLQVDATLIYIKEQNNDLGGPNGRKVLISDTKTESPYNTYLHKGIPQGPIGNPGLPAIKAAIYPTESNYLFYLSSPEGQTIFSSTLAEHNAAKNKYLR